MLFCVVIYNQTKQYTTTHTNKRKEINTMENKGTINIQLDAQDYIRDLKEKYDIVVELDTIDDIEDLAYCYENYIHDRSFKSILYSASGKFQSKYRVYAIRFEFDAYDEDEIIVATVHYNT